MMGTSRPSLKSIHPVARPAAACVTRSGSRPRRPNLALLHGRRDVLDLPVVDLLLDLRRPSAGSLPVPSARTCRCRHRRRRDRRPRPVPPLKLPAFASLIEWKTAVSTRFSAEVRTCVPRNALVGVDADAPDALLLRRVERAEAAAARDLEDDDRARGDLVERDLLALRLVLEVLRVAVERLHARERGLRARLVAGDVAVDRRLLLPADATRRVRRRAPSRRDPRRSPAR